MKKNNNLLIVGIIIAAVLLYMGSQGYFKSIFSVYNNHTIVPTPERLVTQYLSYTVTFSLYPSSICAGESTTGSISSNIPNGVCSIFMKSDTSWTLYKNVNLDVNGHYSETNTINTPGSAYFAGICCDNSGNCRMSNQVLLTVNVCGNDFDGDGIPDSEDPDDDNDGYTDIVEIDAGTNPKDENSHPTESNCNSYCIGLGGYTSGRFVTSPGYCNAPEISKTYSNGWCCCMPSSSGTCNDNDYSSVFENSLKTSGKCTDSSEHFDDCVDGMLKEFYCTQQNQCSHTEYNCEAWFGSKSYCRNDYCFIDPYINPSNCASTCGSFDWSYQIDNAENCLDANVNLCYYSGQMTGVHSYHSENNCCCFTCG